MVTYSVDAFLKLTTRATKNIDSFCASYKGNEFFNEDEVRGMLEELNLLAVSAEVTGASEVQISDGDAKFLYDVI